MFSGTFLLRANRRISSRCDPSVTRPLRTDKGYETLSLVTSYTHGSKLKDLCYKKYLFTPFVTDYDIMILFNVYVLFVQTSILDISILKLKDLVVLQTTIYDN